MENFLYGAAAAVTSICIVHPVDVIKTRLQLQGESASHSVKQYTGITNGLLHVAKGEGVRGLYKGLQAACILQITVTGTRFGTYSFAKGIIGVDENSKYKHAQNTMLAMGAGVAGAVVGNPFYAIKTRFQANSGDSIHAVGHQHKLTSLHGALRTILVEEGIRGYFRGISVFIPRVVAFSTGQLATYDFCKQRLLSRGFVDGVSVHLASSCGAAMIGITMMQPFDFLAARIMNQPMEGGRPLYYTGVLDCAIKAVKAEGIQVLYKGASANYARMVPYTILCFCFFEQYKGFGDRYLKNY
eukprot:CFRG4260T1